MTPHIRPIILAVSAVMLTLLSALWVRAQTATQRVCETLVTVRIDSLTVVNAEEARGAADFGEPGDEITLSYALGPIDVEGEVDYGALDEHIARWSGALQPNQRIDGIGSLARHVCADDFGVRFALIEDDSTVFGPIFTRMGAAQIVPLFQASRIVREARAYTVNITGETQDGNFDYQIAYSLTYENQPVRQIDLTPTLSPTPTFTPSPSATPSATHTATLTYTPSPTETPSPTLTLTPSETFTPSRTPTITRTPTSTHTPTFTYTPTPTPTVDLAGTNAALVIQMTDFAITIEAANVLGTQQAFFAAQTQFAVAQTQTYAALFPSATPTPSHTPTFTPTYTPSATPTASFTPTDTPPPTATFTPSLTPSKTPLPTATATFTHTWTPSATYTPSQTYTPSNTPLPSATPTITGTPTPLVCAGTLPSRLYPGLRARVTRGGVPNRVRRQPGLDSTQIGEIRPLEEFVVTDGPICIDAYIWYEVNGEGWTAEASGSEYFIEAIFIPTATPDRCFIYASEPIRQRAAPSTTAEVVGQLQPRTNVFVVGQQVGTDGFVWWNLETGVWVREDTVNENNDGLCASVPVVP